MSNATAATKISFPYLTYLSPPPDNYEEVLVPAEPSKEIWRPGFWEYRGDSFNWMPGHLMARPTLSAVWSPDHWEKREYGWAFVHGYWQ